MLKKSIVLLVLVSLLMHGCISSSNTLNISPEIQLPKQDPSLTGITISIHGADQRIDQSLTKVNRNGQLTSLNSSRDLRFLLQEALEKQMIARGYMIDSNSTVDLHIIINKLYADVYENSVKHSITTKADISVLAQARNGNRQVKNYQSVYNVQGIFHATNSKIAAAVNSVLTDLIKEMAKDSSINIFIKQNSF